jgi:hypothetical protein
MTPAEMKLEASNLADKIRAIPSGTQPMGTAIDRNQRSIRAFPDDLWNRFIRFRGELYRKGIYDPVLGRFDSATVTQADSTSIADQLVKLAGTLN